IFNCPSLKVGANSFSYYSAANVRSSVSLSMGWGAPGDDDTDSVKVMYGYNGLYLGGGQWSSTHGADFAKSAKVPNASNWYNDGVGALETTIQAPALTVLLLDNNPSNASAGFRWYSFAATIESTNDAGGDVWSSS